MIKRSSVVFLMMIFSSFFAFSTTLILAKFLGANEYGKFNYYLAFASAFNLVLNFGVSYFVPSKIKNNRIMLTNYFKSIAIIYVLAGIFYAVILRVLFSFEYLQLLWIVLYSLVLISSEIFHAYYIGINKSEKGTFLIQLLPKIIIFVFSVILIFKYRTHEIYLYVFLATYIAFLFPIVIKNIILRGYKISNVKHLMGKDIITLSIVTLLYGLFTPLSKVFLAETYSFDITGIFSISIQIALIIRLMMVSFINLLIPIFVKLYDNKDYGSIGAHYQRITGISIIIILPISLIVITNSKLILSFLGDNYISGVNLFILLYVSQIINTAFGPNGTLLNITGNQKFEIYNGVLKLSISLIIMLFLGNIVFYSIGIAFLLSELVVNLVKTMQIKKVFGFYPVNNYLQIFINILVLSAVFSLSLLIHNEIIKVVFQFMVVIGYIYSQYIFNADFKTTVIELFRKGEKQ